MKPAWRRRHSASSSPRVHGSAGFTLLELFVVLIVIVALMYLFAARVNRPKPNMPLRCLSNLKQLTLGWVLYADDSKDILVSNQPYASASPVPTNNWVVGVMDWTASPQNTNSDLLSAGALGAYLKYSGVYRCPDDKSQSAAGPRVRSYSMNGFMGNGGSESAFPGWKQCLKMADIARPATMFVFADEHANSIDDGFFINNPNQTNAWTDLPASRHDNGGAGFAFADGHSEIHKWVDASTRLPTKPSGPKPNVKITSKSEGTDLAWVLNATASRELVSTNEPSK